MSSSMKTLKRIGVSKEISDGWIAELQKPHRHYHTLSHVSHIIQCYEEVGGDDRAILAAAWLHDIRYDPRRGDNEEISAEIAKEDLKGTTIDIPLVVDIILDTKLHAALTPLSQLFSDLDLAILGTSLGRYTHYMHAIRREFAFVPLDVYASKRAEILENFNEQKIYKTDYFLDHEKTAHRNLQAEIELLRNDPERIEVVSK